MTIPSLEEFIKTEKAKVEKQILNYGQFTPNFECGFDHGQSSAYNRILNYIEYVRTEGQ